MRHGRQDPAPALPLAGSIGLSIRVPERLMSASGRKRPFVPILAEGPLSGVKRTFNYEHPGYAGNLIINLPRIPSLPNLISSFLINQQGFDVDFGEHS